MEHKRNPKLQSRHPENYLLGKILSLVLFPLLLAGRKKFS